MKATMGLEVRLGGFEIAGGDGNSNKQVMFFMFEGLTRVFFAGFAHSLLRMSMSEEENIDVEQCEDLQSALEFNEEQDEEDVELSIQAMISNRRQASGIDANDVFGEEDGNIQDESAETEPMETESCLNFRSMLDHVQKLSQELHEKRVALESLMARLHGHSTWCKIEPLVNRKIVYNHRFVMYFKLVGCLQIAHVDRRLSTLLAEGFVKVH
jgi:hypothetical protein